jgi:hypothetical protein
VGLVLDPHDARTIVVTLFCSKKNICSPDLPYLGQHI